MRKLATLILALFLTPLALPAADAPAAKKPLTLERITADPPLAGRGVTGLRWRDGRRFTYLKAEAGGRDARVVLWQEDAATGEKSVLAEPIPLEEKGKDGKPKTLPLSGAQWNGAGTALLLSGDADLFVYDLATKALERITKDAEAEEHPTFSPDGKWVAFVKKNDLYAMEIATKAAVRLTFDGSETVLNGHLDWVYEEELAQRNGGRAYEWSPDSRAIAYLRLDQARVPEYPIVDFLPTNGKHEPQRYPKAGDPNAIPSVHLVDVAAGATVRTAISAAHQPDDYLVGPELSFTPDGRAVAWVKLDRTQTKKEVWLLGKGGSRLVLAESDPAWVNPVAPPEFLPDGSFLLLSERSGFLHLYRHGADFEPKGAVTKGPWTITGEPVVRAKAGVVFFQATEKDPRERHYYKVKLDGSGFTRLTSERGSHNVIPSPDGAFLLDTFSGVETTPKTVLRKGDGTIVRTVDEPKGELAEYQLATVEQGSFKGKDGTLFYTRLVKPPDFDPGKKYPVIVYVYGGPHAQVVQDRWGAASLFDHLAATKGFLVWAMDNRGSGARGHAFETPILKRLGEVELADQLEGIAELKKLPFVDPARIGISGWSYGGYMALFAATHAPDVFKVAVAGAPVTHWKYYDSIYTDRYMKLPKDNVEGYEKASPLTEAGKLGPKLLILHGTSDDNVHMQNSIAFVDALMRARKDVTFVPLPRQKHGPREPAARLYTNQRILEFFERNL